MGNPIPRRHGDVDTEAPKKYGANFADQQYFKRRFAEGASVEDVSRETNIRMDCVEKFHPEYKKGAAKPAPEVTPKVKVEKPKPVEVVLESPLAAMQEDDLDDSDDVSSDDGEPEEGAASPTKRRRRR